MPGQLRLRKHRTLLLGLALSLSVATLTFVATGLRAQGGAHDNRRRSPGGAGVQHPAGSTAPAWRCFAGQQRPLHSGGAGPAPPLHPS